jgi:outer membrane receptor protein involved in Fe transport
MSRHSFSIATARGRVRALGAALAVLLCAPGVPARAATTGKIQGRIIASDTGEPIGFADVALVPADSAMRRVGGFTNADGSFLLEALPGRYALQIRALSYAHKRIEGIVIEAGRLVPLSTALAPEAIQQEEVVVEGKARMNSELSMLAARKKAAALSDAVSAEQVRKSPDKDAAEVLRRVTGLSVSDDKYVFVRGLGERYSSTEVDGVRIASPEQNKRVVPLDLVPANLLENIVVQKTYTADRPGEFGGGDVQVHTKDFPGNRTYSLSVSQGQVDNVTFHDRRTYPGSSADPFGFGADSRRIPNAVYDLAGDRKLDPALIPKATLVAIGKSFRDVWSPTSARTVPNSGYSATYGDEFKVLGHSLGLIESWSMTRAFDRRNESQRLFRSSNGDTFYDYNVDRATATAQLGGLSGLSYRISPRHAIHLRGLYTHDAEDQVRVYEGLDHTREDSGTGGPLGHRSYQLRYVERSVLSGTLEGQDEIPRLFDTSIDWKFTRSRARRLLPDMREVIYDHRSFYDFGTGQLVRYWGIGSQGEREFGDLRDNGWGTTLNATVPWRLGSLGNGKVLVGYDRQTKQRGNFYRRFEIQHNTADSLLTASPDTLFGADTFDGSSNTAYVIEKTYNDSRYTDNYRARQRVEAGYLSADIPFGPRVRGSFGVRVESGFQDVQSFDLFNRDSVVQEGKLANLDWLPSGNITWGVTHELNLRFAVSRTLSRPDLNELSPSPSLDYQGGFVVLGNPHLRRAVIENYDVRAEAFPTPSEVFATGFFYKRLHHPIERVILGSGGDPLLIPRNSDSGSDLGMEFEARSNLARAWRRLNGLSINTNAAIISSDVKVVQGSQNGSDRHPLEGQANFLVNGGVSYLASSNRLEATVLVSATGKRLRTLGFLPLPDIYDQPFATLDATMGFVPFRGSRVKFAARNLLDPRIQQLQGHREVSGYRAGRSYSLAFSYGS